MCRLAFHLSPKASRGHTGHNGLGEVVEVSQHDGSAASQAVVTAVRSESLLGQARSRLSGRLPRRLLGALLTCLWVAWLVAAVAFEPRPVTPSTLAEDLADGWVVSYRVVTVSEDPAGPFAVVGGAELSPLGAADRVVALESGASSTGEPVTLAYWTDHLLASTRYLDTNGLPSDLTAALAEQLQAAGTPEAPEWLPGSDAVQRTRSVAGWVLLLSLAAVVIGPRPGRGTRWFWFWLLPLPLMVGVPLYAVLELLRPLPGPVAAGYPPGPAGRRRGGTGFLLAVLGGFAGQLLLGQLASWSPLFALAP